MKLLIALLLLCASCRDRRIDVGAINALVPAEDKGLHFSVHEVESGFPHVVRYLVASPDHWHIGEIGGIEASSEHGASRMWVHSGCEEAPCKLHDWDAFIDRQLDAMFATVEQDHRGDHRRVVIGRQTIYDLRYLLVASSRDGDPELDECEVHLQPQRESELPAFQKACEAAIFLGFVRDGQPPEDHSWHPTTDEIMFGVFVCFAFGVITSLVAVNRQRSGRAWFALGALLPLIGLVVLLVRAQPADR